MADGDVQQVEFDSPHGLVEYNGCIYIADTNNHAIRVVRTLKKTISKVYRLENLYLVRSKFSSCADIDWHRPFGK
jgi:hypothetical protein